MNDRWDPASARRLVGRSPMILEIGANNGTDSAALLRTFPRATLHCFEPEPTAIEQWQHRIISPQAHLHQVAISATTGTATFHRSGGWPPGVPNPDGRAWNESGSLRTPTGHLEEWPWVEFPDSIEVATTDLDSWTTEHGIDRIDLIWADVQGAEGDLVRGAQRTLERTRLLYIETSEVEWYEGQVSTSDLLEGLPGWEVLERFPYDILLRNEGLQRQSRWRRGPRR